MAKGVKKAWKLDDWIGDCEHCVDGVDEDSVSKKIQEK